MLLGGLLLASPRRATGPAFWLAAPLLAWLPLHALLGFQPWERYLLPLVPVSALALAMGEGRGGVAGRGLAIALLLLAPAAAIALQIEPQGNGWQGIAEMGRTVEALPAAATVYYLGAGRPLAWYAADATAALRWAGPDGRTLRADLAIPAPQPRYLVARRADPLPPAVAGWAVAAEAGFFYLLAEPLAGLTPP